MRRVILLIGVIGGLGAAWAAWTATARPAIQLAPALVDFGPIAERTAIAVEVRNVGRAPLQLLGVSASCGCTTAAIDASVVPPGEGVPLSITFDPAAHGPELGPASHAVYVRTNDPRAPEAELEVRAVVLQSPVAAGPPVTIYFNGSCHDCVPYLDNDLVPLLRSFSVGEITRRDYILERRYRAELVERSRALGIPPQLQGHMTIFVGDRVVLQGHVPAHIIRDLFAPAQAGRYTRVVVLQDKMASHGEAPKDYTVWSPGGAIAVYPLDAPVTAYLAGLPPPGAAVAAVAPVPAAAARPTLAFTAMVLGAGLLDGINPCAFAVLLLFVAFLFTLQRGRPDLLAFGFTYIGAIYLTYLGIGLGLLTVFQLGAPHLLARLGAGLMIVLGLVNIKDFFWYGVGPSLSLPKIGAAARDRWMRRATLPATAVVGFLVGICEFPCTGGVYVGVLGLLAAQTTYWTGLTYLVAYNVMFVLPLVALLLVIGNRRVVGQFSRWMATNKRQLRLGQGAVMVAIGVVILLWFV